MILTAHRTQGDVGDHYEKISQSVEALLDGAEQYHMRASVEHDKAIHAALKVFTVNIYRSDEVIYWI